MSSDEAVMNDRRAVLTIIALLLTLGCAGLLLSKVQNEFASPRYFAAYEFIWWALVILLLSYVRWVERRPLASIGFRRPGIRNILIGLAAGIVIFAGLAAIYLVILPALHFEEDPQVTQVMSTPLRTSSRMALDCCWVRSQQFGPRVQPLFWWPVGRFSTGQMSLSSVEAEKSSSVNMTQKWAEVKFC